MTKWNWIRKIAATSLGAVIGLSALAASHPGQADAATPKSIKLLSNGKQYLGVPYRLGAPSGVTYAFDCSSFTQYVFKKSGVSLPRTSGQQYYVGKKVPKGSLSMGDLVFFTNSNGRGIGHVGIYAGNNRMLHTTEKSGVAITSLSISYWSNHYVTAKRVLS